MSLLDKSQVSRGGLPAQQDRSLREMKNGSGFTMRLPTRCWTMVAKAASRSLSVLAVSTSRCCLRRSAAARYLGLVSFDIHIAGICEQCDCVGGREKLMQQLHALWSQDTDKNAHTSKVILGSTETIDEAHLDRIGACYEDNGNRFGRCLRSKCRRGRQWHKSPPHYGPPVRPQGKVSDRSDHLPGGFRCLYSFLRQSRRPSVLEQRRAL